MTMADRPGTKSSQGEIVIVGGGLAGLFCALKLAPHPVTVLAAAPIGQGASSAWAQAGIAASVSPGDSTEKHLADTVEAGAGIVDVDIASTMVAEGPQRVFDLLSYGVPFDRDPSGKLLAAREAAHSERRVVGVRGDMAGKAIMDALVAAVRKTPSIRVVECFVAEELLVSQGQVSGVLACHTARRARIRLNADAVALCTGGIGHLYNVTTNPAQSGGDGIGMAARAGARIADPEFVQFHPTAIDVGRDPAPLATEALRGDGAILVNSKNHRFMVDLHKDAELAPRDIVARGIFAEIKADRGAFLDCTKAIGSHFQQKFPTVFAHCAQAGIDPVHQPIPVIPAAHYHMGGIHTGVDGRTSVGGLWAAGEVASTGVHGANRLASNSLLEAVVFAARIAEDMKHRQPPAQHSRWTDPVDEPGAPDDEELPSQMNRLRRLMGMCAGVIREEKDLRKAARSILEMKKDCSSLSFLNSLTAAAFVIAGALQRTESRGGHFRIDYPQPDLQWQKRTYMTLQQTELLLRDAAERTIA